MTKRSPQAAKSRILEAAGDIFTETDFDHATVRDICARAGVNLAAVNYHFKDKAGLYQAVLLAWWEEALARRPPEADQSPESPARERLRRYVRDAVLRIFDFGPVGPRVKARRGRLLLREFAKDSLPAEPLRACLERELAPLFPVVSELLGSRASQEAILACCLSVRAQVIHYFLMFLHEPEAAFAGEEALLDMAEHIATFSLGGLAAIREADRCQRG